MAMEKVIEKYLGIIADEFHRYKSWDNSFHAYFAATSRNGDVAFWFAKIYLRNVRQGPRRWCEERIKATFI